MDAPSLRISSRRDVVESLRRALATGLLLALALLPAASGAVEPSTDHDIVIVGAGAAGLYAAYTLDNLGYDVLVLEATDRHGGRVYSDTLGDVGIEHGAEELYGATNNFVFNDIKSEYGAQAQLLQQIAHTFALCNQPQEAIAAIHRALELGISAEILAIDDEFSSLRDRADFIALVGADSSP